MMFNDSKDRSTRRSSTNRVIGCTAALAVVATTVLTAQAAQASAPGIITVGGTTIGGSSLISSTPSGTSTGTPILTGTTVPLLGSTGGSTSGSVLGIGTGSTTGSLVGIGSGSSGGVTVGVGNGLATVTLGGDGSSGTGTVTVGTPTTTTITPTTPTNPSAPGTTTDPAAPVNVLKIAVDKSVSTVYPKKDGYRDTVSFLVDATTSTGQVTAVTGEATLKKGSKTVRAWSLSKSTQSVVWNGRVGKLLKTGKYVLSVVEKAAGGAVHRASTSVMVSGESLVSRTVVTKTVLKAHTKRYAMPAAVRRAYSKGKVYIRVTTVIDSISSSAKRTAKLTFINGKHVASRKLVSGKFTSPKFPVPNTKAFRSVVFRHDWKAGTVKLRAIRIDWVYKTLK